MATDRSMLFSWDDVERLPDLRRLGFVLDNLRRLGFVLDNLPDGAVLEALRAKRGRGRDEYPVQAMWRALVAGLVFGHASSASLLRELGRNPALLQLCGFDPLQRGKAGLRSDDHRQLRSRGKTRLRFSHRHAAKGLPNGIGSGTGDWRLMLASGLDIEVLSYIRTPSDGFLTSMHDLVPVGDDGSHRVPVFNPATNVDQVSRLRVMNPGEEAARVTVAGIDGNGEPGRDDVRLTVPAGAARTLDAQELEAGGSGFQGRLGAGAGK